MKIKDIRIVKKIINKYKDIFRTYLSETIYLRQFDNNEFSAYNIVAHYIIIVNYINNKITEDDDKIADAFNIDKISFLNKIDIIKKKEKTLEVECDNNDYIISGFENIALGIYFKKVDIKIRYNLDSKPKLYKKIWVKENLTDALFTKIIDTHSEIISLIDIKKIINSEFYQYSQKFGKGEIYQSFKELNIKGQRPTQTRFSIYKLDNYLNKNTKILDIGCNIGFFSLYVAKKTLLVDGVEYNNELAKIANITKNYLGRFNCTFFPESFTDFKTERKYNVIFSFAVHYWIGMNLNKYGKTLRALLEDNGIVIFESQRLDTIDNDFEKHVEILCSEGFEKIDEDYLKDDNIINRKFVILRKKD